VSKEAVKMMCVRVLSLSHIACWCAGFTDRSRQLHDQLVSGSCQ